jgi:hypothetical protein
LLWKPKSLNTNIRHILVELRGNLNNCKCITIKLGDLPYLFYYFCHTGLLVLIDKREKALKGSRLAHLVG